MVLLVRTWRWHGCVSVHVWWYASGTKSRLGTVKAIVATMVPEQRTFVCKTSGAGFWGSGICRTSMVLWVESESVVVVKVESEIGVVLAGFK